MFNRIQFLINSMTSFVNWSHFRAVVFRRWVLIKRSFLSVFFTIVASLFFAFLAIIAQYLISTLAVEDVTPVTFNTYKTSDSSLVLLFNPGEEEKAQPFVSILREMYQNDTGRDPIFFNFTNITEMNEWMYYHTLNQETPHLIDAGIWFRNLTTLDFPIFYNSTTGFLESANDRLLSSQIMLLRIKYRQYFHHDFVFSVTTLYKRTLDRIFGQIGPMLITGALISIIPLIISQPIIDTRGEVRSYMVSCTMSMTSYWTATFLIDFVLWIINSICIWLIFICFNIAAFMDNKFNTIYAFIMSGPAFIIHIYCFSFAFATADSASRQAFIIVCLALVVPIIVDIIRNDVTPGWLNWIYTFYPPMIIQRSLMAILPNLGSMSHNLPWYFKDSNNQPLFIMQYGQIPIWIGVLIFIEYIRDIIKNGSAKRTFGNYTEIFNDAKKKHQYTDEAKEMEEQVKNRNNHFAVRINNVSRLFFNTAGKPVTAVNGVSLGVKENSIFGFLGANGAGKTTLIKMITSMLPTSNGTIEINGVDISEYNDPTLLSICPQFNSHLCEEMTPLEHFYMYSLFHRLGKEESQKRTNQLIKELDLESFKNQPIRELSGGDVRKLSIALSFLAPAKIVLLDEPTASLDPVARHHVHEMILSYKGQKTFMLCTHLLSEAEFLCDMISIMIKGCVYTCGTPQYLTQRFGTDFKIDVMLSDETSASAEKLNEFFMKKLPTAQLSIVRPKARIYSIPAADHSLPDLFEIMQNGQDEDNGFNYFTCSSSSLERVFMELVHMSENDDIAFATSV
ncbi:ABC transporter family protein [Tritrichomonas foetus]|uniref:ABC transporter family protein n=1 Tax=Tritrichomonas foetus TaxID=1144522 RepID=A0A1J4K3X8_9EUKA|nr:ABC transporter family protein [Tritrichomonas foetus]|eukprot:OHT04460.1 ABC transporter family protein [Tritrichomonas foetus]